MAAASGATSVALIHFPLSFRSNVSHRLDIKMKKNPWAGRFSAAMDPLVERYTRSIHFDSRLAFHDILGSRAHVRMLCAQGLLSVADRDAILSGLDQVEVELRDGSFPFRDELEDIHMNIERRLQELIGEPAERLHTGRSRNDQVALDLRLYCLDTALRWQGLVKEVITELVSRADDLKLRLFPAWTHMQAAQPLSWGHYLLAYSEMLGRDFGRLEGYRSLHHYSPLGAGALSGSSLPLDPESTARDLGFPRSFGNSYDVVGDRDALVELLQIAAQLMIHLSRFAEDFIYFASTPVSWVSLPDALCTGSSMMPQKKNPDVLELMRGKTASVLGHLNSLMILLKGLPSSYQRDLQQDKVHLFDAVDIVDDSLEIMPLLLKGFSLNGRRSEEALDAGFLMATELAEYLVAQGVPFRTAHHQTGALVGHCVQKGVQLNQLPLEEIQQFAPACDEKVMAILEPEGAIRSRTYKGSTGLESIKAQIACWKVWVSEH